MQIDSEEFTQVMMEAIIPALNTKSSLTWKLDVHILSEEESAAVYVLKCSPRPLTRSIISGNRDISLALPMKVFEY